MHKKWNISILVLFVLLASSLLGVLTMTFVQHMMKQTATLYTYYQSYYLAKAGIEFGLAQLPFRGIWFEYIVNTGNLLLASNFLCASKWCDFSFSLSGTSSELSEKFWEGSGCLSPFTLKTGQSLLFPLVKDIGISSGSFLFSGQIFNKNLYKEIKTAKIITTDTVPIVYGMLVLSGWDLASDWIYFQTWVFDTDGLWKFLKNFEEHIQLPTLITNSNISPYALYLMVSSLDHPLSFCLSSSESLPTQQYYLKSLGHYHQQSIWLEAIYRQPIPDFLMNTYGFYGRSE